MLILKHKEQKYLFYHSKAQYTPNEENMSEKRVWVDRECGASESSSYLVAKFNFIFLDCSFPMSNEFKAPILSKT